MERPKNKLEIEKKYFKFIKTHISIFSTEFDYKIFISLK